jgi:hypothetical protein
MSCKRPHLQGTRQHHEIMDPGNDASHSLAQQQQCTEPKLSMDAMMMLCLLCASTTQGGTAFERLRCVHVFGGTRPERQKQTRVLHANNSKVRVVSFIPNSSTQTITDQINIHAIDDAVFAGQQSHIASLQIHH